ncbi:hypothetical protein GCM10010302_74740 [Streptomyces polychromogenes]|uniref:Uncharacterized protein n=1 Tax=Streptomyces polychromogenes TaxID=67342 RepID=A0ABN0W464_9ACTN
MIEIETYLRGADGEFVQVEGCTTRPVDGDYVEGTVRNAIHGVEVTGLREWDYVGQLWAYMAGMAPQLSATGHASTYFPDQPIELSFRRQGSQVLVSVRIGSEVKKANVSGSSFIDALRAAGTAFFDKMSELLPENMDSYSESRRELLS